jgi:hypothetical protein
MKKFNSFLFAVALVSSSFVFNACGDDTDGGDGGNTNTEKEVIITSNIKTNTTWTKDKTWILGGRIAVEAGATLTIEAGTIIKGQAGTGANATALIIARGAKLDAQGTASAPIIFTSIADEIVSGQIESPNLPNNFAGLWGGILIMGKAPCSLGGDVIETNIEGVPVTDPNGLYGGNDIADNSGVIKFISIRHGGANIGEGNEINGLTLGGVGNGTIIENVEVIANQDDGIEWFGGSVNVKNAIVWNSGDDALDTDQAWSGTMDNFIIICGDQTDHALEIDGPEGSANAGHNLINGWVKGHPISELGDFRSNAQGTFKNIYFFNFDAGMPAGRGDLSLDAKTVPNFGTTLTFDKLEVTSDTMNISKIFKNGTVAHATKVTTPTVGANTAAFAGWSWAAKVEAYK